MEKNKTYQWVYETQPDNQTVDHLKEVLSVDTCIATLLAQKKITSFDTARNFFRPTLSQLYKPLRMKDMAQAVSRVCKAIEEKQHILVYGDYDVDGTTSVAMMYQFLRTLTKNVTFYIPDRYKEGYGVSFEGMQYAIDHNVQLLITLDCGIKAHEKIAFAKNNGIDSIICDHHLPEEQLPEAIAILNPKRSDCSYPFKELSGCGVGFKLIQALCEHLQLPNQNYLQYLDLVAVSIAADIVPLIDENRILTFYGLEKLNKDPQKGLATLLHQDKKLSKLSVSDIVFKIAPKINAAGRIEHASLAVNILTEQASEQLKKLNTKIQELNNQRKLLDKEVTDQALMQIIENNDIHKSATVVYDETWHKGVLGIVASRLTESYYRPTIVFCKSGDYLAASARSIPGYDLYSALSNCSEWLTQFGGHKYAAGLTMKAENYQAFKEAFEKTVAETMQPEIIQPKINIATKITLFDLHQKNINIIKQFAPFGPKNMKPIFDLSLDENCHIIATKIGADKKHLKIEIHDYINRVQHDCIGFNLAQYSEQLNTVKKVHLAITIEENTWQGRTKNQLNIKAIQFIQ